MARSESGAANPGYGMSPPFPRCACIGVLVRTARNSLRFGISFGLLASSSFPAEQKKEAERRKTQVRTTAPSEGAARALRGALAFRRSTAALAQGSRRPEGAATGQASWATAPRSAGFPAGGLPTSSDAPRTPVIVPAG